MKTSAAEYFTSLSPVKDDGNRSGRGVSARGGRCHCCPYGYHIDLDFVRYCHTLAKGCEQESATLRKLKQSKRQRRRETHSMEVMLGLTPQQQQNGDTALRDAGNKAPTPPPRRNSLKHLQNHINNNNNTHTTTTSTTTSRQYHSTTNGTTPPDVVSMIAANNTANKSPSPDKFSSRPSRSTPQSTSTFNEASDALQEAMLDFEVALESSNECDSPTSRKRSLSLSAGPPSLDLLQHNRGRKTGVTSDHRRQAAPVANGCGMGTAMASILAQSAVNRVRSNSVTRSNSLPRYFPDESPHAAWFSRVRPSPPNAGHATHNYEKSQQPTAGLSLREALASLEAARGGRGGVCSPPPLPDDTLSVTSAASQLSTSTLQSIRDQMATGLSRLRELEAEVRNIPHLQRELETLRTERQQLQRVVEQTRAEDETSSHRTRDLLTATSRARRRSQSPVRVNLEEFCSYRRARAGSDCSDTESVTSERRYGGVSTNRTYTANDLTMPKNSLFISEMNDTHQLHKRSPDPTVPAARIEEEADISTRLAPRRLKRDASTMCKVLTRDVGIHHAARVRSVGVMADLLLPPPPPPPVPQESREKSPKRDLKRPSLGSLFSVTRSTQTVEYKVDAKTKLLNTLGRQNSSIINRLAEVQTEAPALTFDNSTNTEAKHFRNQNTNTEQTRTREQKTNTMLSSQQVMSKDEVDSAVNEKVKQRVQEQLERAKKNWDFDFNDKLQKRLREEVIKVEESYKIDFERELEIRVSEKVRSELARAKKSIEQDINDEVDSRVTEEVDRAKHQWEASQKSTKTSKPMTRDRSVQAVISLPVVNPEVKVEKPSTRSVSSGDCRLTDILCEKCVIPKRSVGCSWDKVTDLVCDKCEERKHSLNLKPITKSTSMQTAPVPVTKLSSNFCQTVSIPSKTVSTNTTFLALKKEEPLASVATPALTPELERRPFGSSGVNICDKCHDTITSVAKDIVGTSIGSVSLATGPAIIVPLPPTSGSSKIPRLVDPFKFEPRLDTEDPPPAFLRDSELRRSDSRLDQLNRRGSAESSSVQRRRQPNQTPDLLSDSAAARDIRRNSGPSAIDSDKQKVPFIRQHTYTKLQEDAETNDSVSSPRPVRKMSAFNEEDELLAESEDSKSRKSSSGILSRAKVNTYRRERSSPEIAMKESWKIKVETPVEKKPSEAAGTTDTWAEEMTSYSRTDEANARASRGTSLESNATYKLDNDSKKPSISKTPPSPDKASVSPTRKATPIPQKVAPPSTTSQSPATIPAIVCTSPPPAPSTTTPTTSTTDTTTTTTTTTTTMHQSTASIEDCDLLDDSGDESIAASSVITQSSSVYAATGDPKPRKKAKMGRNLRAALKVLNDSIGKPVRSGQQLTNALNIIQRDWFKVSSQTEANPHYVEDFLDIFEMQYSRGLLHRVVNLADVNGNTAMHYAVSHGNYDVVSLLLDSKVCSVNQQNKAGYTATMLVSLAPIKCPTHACVVERLFSMSDVNVKADQHGQTALMLAVSHGRLDTVRLLLAAGADVNIQDDDGSSALMCAAEHGHLAIVRLLLQATDTDANLVDNDGSSALAIAVEAGHKDVGVLLYKHMNLTRGSSPYSSIRGGRQRSRTPTLPRSTINTPPPRFSAPPSPGRSRRGSGPPSPPSSSQNSPHTRHKHSSASLSNLNF